MLNFIVLGQIPGTSIRLGFLTVLAIILAACLAYLMREQEKTLLKKSKNTRIYGFMAALVRPLWLNALKPSLQLLEQKAVLVPEFAALSEHFKASRVRKKSA